MLKYILTTACIALMQFQIHAQTANSIIDQGTTINTDTKPLLGVTFDARTGMNATVGYVGYFTPTGTLINNIDTLFDDFPLNGLRYPANAVSLGFEWKKSIGSLPRPFQNLLGSMGPSQSMDFGFDEFMAYCESKGLQGKDVQIMVPIYDSAVTYFINGSSTILNTFKNAARVPFPAQNAADWVEYANAPDTVNWGGGIQWGAIRAANGHQEPYNIKTWNIGNEPWGPSEMDFDTSQYFATTKPIIDSMLARDPSIHITIPTAGPANSNWNKMIRNYMRTYGGIYGISPHFFKTLQSVDNDESALMLMIDSCDAVGLKVIVGDFSYDIPDTSTLRKNMAMSWKGVNYTVDMLLMFSQLNTIERANHWAFGMPKAVWRPIRKETNGSYTSLPVCEIYKIITPYFMQRSLATTTTSPIASDMHPYSVRAGAFANLSGDTLTVVALNRDSLNAQTYSVNGVSSHFLVSATILTSDSLTGEIIYSNSIMADINGHFTMPASSILLLKYSSNYACVFPELYCPLIYPNPTNSVIIFPEELEHLEIYNANGQLVLTNILPTRSISVENLSNGIYFIRSGNINKKFIVKH